MTLDDCLREHGPALWRVVASYAPPGAERDDLLQETLLAVWQALPRFRGEGNLRAFVLRVAHNRGLTHAWQRARRPAPTGPRELPDLPDPRPHLDEQLAASQRAEKLMAHVRGLPLGLRQVLALALEGLPHAEIAAVVGITPANVAVRLGRAREALKRSMAAEEAA